MLKKIFLLIFLVCSLGLMFGQDETEVIIFEKFEESVVYIDQSLFLDSKDVSHPNLFKRIEKQYEFEILDSYFTLSSGTGFFISSDGYLLTNYHVIKQDDLTKVKNSIYQSAVEEFFSRIPSSVINRDEYELITNDFKKMIDNAKFNYRILVNNKDSYIAKLKLSDEKLDVALLKIEENKSFKPAPLGDSDLLKVGNFVMAIGYPVPGSLFYAVRDFKSTMTSGKISAIRSDNWGIQHTSPISPGNSGGPLFNKKGEVIGVNVGAVTTGNDLFFSIPMGKIINWLNSSVYSNLVERNKKEAKGMGIQYSLDSEGFLETGTTMLVNLQNGYKVFIDNKFMGNTPVLLENLAPGKHDLKIESDKEFLIQKIMVKGDITDIMTYEPILQSHKGKLFINSNPLGATVYVDGKKSGSTPLALNSVTI